MSDRTAGLERLLEERASKEMGDIEAVLNELAAAIERELDEPEYRQLELWTSEERGQLTRNTEALRRRLDQIPGEIDAEKEAIRDRFADPQPRLFPVAVTFLVPERLDSGRGFTPSRKARKGILGFYSLRLGVFAEQGNRSKWHRGSRQAAKHAKAFSVPTLCDLASWRENREIEAEWHRGSRASRKARKGISRLLPSSLRSYCLIEVKIDRE